jgi:hypothetical protein
MITAAGFTWRLQTGYHRDYERTKTTEKSQAKTRTRSFVLGDSDDGDYFDVQVCVHLNRIFVICTLCMHPVFASQIYLDPTYGSYVFHTMSGQSRSVVNRRAVILFYFHQS